MTMTAFADTTFEEAASFFRQFLADQGENGKILWTFREDVYSRNLETHERDFWIKLPVPAENDSYVKRGYEIAQKLNLGLGISAYARCDDGLCCTLIIPADEEDAQYLMLGPSGVHYSLVQEMPTAFTVRSRLKWFFFGLFPFLFRQGNYIVYLLSKEEMKKARSE